MLLIKNSQRNTVIAYNNSGIPLQKRSQSDLVDLAIIGRKANDRLILDLFEDPLPSLEELLKMKMASAIEKVTNGEQDIITENGDQEEIDSES